jgi:hypothetical protein
MQEVDLAVGTIERSVTYLRSLDPSAAGRPI